MATLANKIRCYIEANSKVYETERDSENFSLYDGGSGAIIKTWNVSGLAEPTAEQLASYESVANTFESNVDVWEARKASYGDIGNQLDLLYKDIVAGKLDTTGEWAKKIKAVKDANVKEAD
tara:strand:+ start:251 stop:613 length:363 start_codon:yes stop_codon:yes gene_type:complete